MINPLSLPARQRAAALRSAGCVRDCSFGRWGVTLDDADYQALIQRYPELEFENNEIDKDMRSKAWLKWMASSASEPYRVTPGGKRI